jgi:hypothetical protein
VDRPEININKTAIEFVRNVIGRFSAYEDFWLGRVSDTEYPYDNPYLQNIPF